MWDNEASNRMIKIKHLYPYKEKLGLTKQNMAQLWELTVTDKT